MTEPAREEVGLREIRQNASDIVQRAEAGQLFTVTVSGRPAAELGPVRPKVWHRWDEIADIFETPMGAESRESWQRDMNLVDGSISDPWER